LRRTGCGVLVAENYAYRPLLVALRDIVESGELEVLFVLINALKRQPTVGW
jgi:predicted dehydrogenase